MSCAARLRDRLGRPVLPVIPLLLVWAPAVFIALQAGIDPELLRVGSQAALGGQPFGRVVPRTCTSLG